MPPLLRGQLRARAEAAMRKLDSGQLPTTPPPSPNDDHEEQKWRESRKEKEPSKTPSPRKRGVDEECRRRTPRLHKTERMEEKCPVPAKKRRASVMEKIADAAKSPLRSEEQTGTETKPEEKEEGIRLPILSFSDEVLTLIFRRLTRKQRFPLSLTCQRFRQVNLDLGSNRFTSMKVDWTNLMQTVSGLIGESEFSFTGDPSSTQLTTSDARVFRRAMVEALTVKFSHSAGAEPAHSYSEIVYNLLKTINYKQIQVHFNCEKDYSAKFINLLVGRRALKEVPVAISWSRECAHNVPRAQKMLSLLPRMDKLTLEWQLTDGRLGSYASITPDQCLLNDDLLVRLAARATEADLIAFGDYTVAGVMAAFEIVCRSKVKRKSVCIHVKKAIIDEIFSKDYNRFQANVKQGVVKYLYDADRKAVLTASFSKIWMQKRWTS